MNIRYRVDLSEAERTELTAMLGGGSHPARKLKRSQTLLAADAGVSDEAIAASICVGLEQLRARWPSPPGDATLSAHVAAQAGQLSNLGVFNMLISDGRQLFCFCGTKLA